MNIFKALEDALAAAAAEMEANYEWTFGLGGALSTSTELDPDFIEVMTKHLLPLLDHEVMLTARIAKLKATRAAVDVELAELGA
jgi:hypothetical protein